MVLCLLVDLEFYLFGKTFLFSLYCPMQVVPILYTVQDRNIPEKTIETCATQHHMYVWCVVNVTPIFMDKSHWLQNVAQHFRPLAGTVHSGTVLYLSVVVGGFGDIPLRENVSGILMLPRAGGHQLVHGPGSKCS